MCDYLESTGNCLYGKGCESEEKVLYNRRQRKCKNATMGITTFITVGNIIVDWYNFVFYANSTQSNIIYTKDTVTDALFWTFLALCVISTILMLFELASFVLQLKDARIHESPIRRSELYEEVVSWCILLFENFGISLIFLIGFFLGFCPMTAQIRSLTGRIALVTAAVSVIWRLVQSFSFCVLCSPKTDAMICCQVLRAVRGFIIMCALTIIAFLLSISMSLQIGYNLDKYNGRYYGGQFSDLQQSVYLYQRISVPYTITSNQAVNQCNFLESKVKIAESSDLENINNAAYIKRFPCKDFSQFYYLFISETHSELLASYDCDVIIGIKNSDTTSSRIVNAAYELRDPEQKNCVSNSISLLLDNKYEPENSYATEPGNIWSNITLNGMRDSLCGEPITCDIYNRSELDHPVFDCNYLSCVNDSGGLENQSLALVSRLLVSEHEIMSYYPCMPKIDVYDLITLPTCDTSIIPESMVSTGIDSMVSYTSCLDPYLTRTDNKDDWEHDEQDYLQILKI